jgi:2-polyprenyl-3-methyl-5-hydroxy-6-metoxy-1,4-benzoquinol methylase
MENNQMREYANDWDNFSRNYNLKSVKHLGDEWGAVAPIVDEYVRPYLNAGMHVLEIGPGGGRFTDELIKVAGVEAVDVADCSQAMIDRCVQRFGDKLKTFLTDGRTIDAIKPASPYDFVFSYDVFCHIDLYDIGNILSRLKTLVKPASVLVIHHSDVTRTFGLEHWIGLRQMFKGEDVAGSFSVNSGELMRVMLRYNGFRILKQMPARNGRDTVTVAQR